MMVVVTFTSANQPGPQFHSKPYISGANTFRQPKTSYRSLRASLSRLELHDLDTSEVQPSGSKDTIIFLV